MQTDTQTEIYYGWYSAEAKEGRRKEEYYYRIFWKTRNGDVVEVTCVTKDKEGESYKWPDKVFVGECIQFVCKTKGDFNVY